MKANFPQCPISNRPRVSLTPTWLRSSRPYSVPLPTRSPGWISLALSTLPCTETCRGKLFNKHSWADEHSRGDSGSSHLSTAQTTEEQTFLHPEVPILRVCCLFWELSLPRKWRRTRFHFVKKIALHEAMPLMLPSKWTFSLLSPPAPGSPFMSQYKGRKREASSEERDLPITPDTNLFSPLLHWKREKKN